MSGTAARLGRLAFAEQKFYFLIPDEKPHWSESLAPWLVVSAILVALALFLLIHVQKPKMQALHNQTEVNKTFHIMPLPNKAVTPSPVKPQVIPHPRPVVKPHQVKPQLRPVPVPRPVPRPVPHPVFHPRALPQKPQPAVSQAPSTLQSIQPSGPPHINLGRLQEQMDQAAREATASPPLPKFENPKGPVADFYIAGWIQKLERIGDLNYPGSMVGQLKVKVVLNPQGGLERIIMVDPSGNKELDAAAERIIRLSFPYMPFSKQLAAQTRKIEIPLNMHFMGVRRVNAW
ncbi:energy transducer TonB family protein [Acidithiobacillus thiooxidans]|uniref:energy transducer TonB family protein n=1 Tax=Acidithiobacillus thiooxidans TaxID=930 RepID=UPI001D016691|nr:energy transducer TonB [Acidithiobacillus thiooxidans]